MADCKLRPQLPTPDLRDELDKGKYFRLPGHEAITYWTNWMAEMEERDWRFIKKEESTRFGSLWTMGERRQESAKDDSEVFKVEMVKREAD